jgi:hypothetical protein
VSPAGCSNTSQLVRVSRARGNDDGAIPDRYGPARSPAGLIIELREMIARVGMPQRVWWPLLEAGPRFDLPPGACEGCADRRCRCGPNVQIEFFDERLKAEITKCKTNFLSPFFLIVETCVLARDQKGKSLNVEACPRIHAISSISPWHKLVGSRCEKNARPP